MLSPRSAAEVEGRKGIFDALTVGEMVEVRVENIGIDRLILRRGTGSSSAICFRSTARSSAVKTGRRVKSS